LLNRRVSGLQPGLEPRWQ